MPGIEQQFQSHLPETSKEKTKEVLAFERMKAKPYYASLPEDTVELRYVQEGVSFLGSIWDLTRAERVPKLEAFLEGDLDEQKDYALARGTYLAGVKEELGDKSPLALITEIYASLASKPQLPSNRAANRRR